MSVIPRRAVNLLCVLLTATISALAFADADDHGQAPMPEVKIRSISYVIPKVTLTRDDGKEVSLQKELDDGRPVILNFIFTTCPGICPMMSQVFSQFQRGLGTERGKVHMVSISIDPEQDRPPALRAYAKKFSAGRQWQHYTGTTQASVAVQKAFDTYRGDKMSHDPLTLMRAGPGQPWLRIEGMATASELLDQYHRLTTPAAPTK